MKTDFKEFHKNYSNKFGFILFDALFNLYYKKVTPL